MTIDPGPGEAAPPQRLDPPPRPEKRIWYEPIAAWVRAGTDRWWRIPISIGSLPPRGAPGRRTAYSRLRGGWAMEMARQGYTTGDRGEYTMSLDGPDLDGREWFTWGPKSMIGEEE